jgi:tetratricopeptide (TPR) repeat protein/predicted Ser/Thr protein kinase
MAAEDDSLRRERLAELLGQYLDRLNDGETVDDREVQAAHPDLAPDLVRELRTFRRLGSGPAANGGGPVGTLGDYRLLRQVGRGGMGVVYEAWQGSMDRRVALKVLPAGVAADQKTFLRFMREARIAGKIHHENVVPVYGMGVEADTPYYSMEFIDGETLAQVLARRRETGETPSPEECYRLAEEFAAVAEGLEHAHSLGVIHRDLKPSNIIRGREGRLRILDFGLARLATEATLTRSGDVLGTPLYMSPEQAMAKRIPIDHRTDIYSLGATLYEMFAGRPPFEGKDHQDTLSQIIFRDPGPINRVNRGVPRDLETIVLECLRKDPADRYGTAEALAQDLRRFVRGDPIEARPQSGWERAARRLARHRGRFLVGTGVLVLLCVCGVLGLSVESERKKQAMLDCDRAVASAAMKLMRGELMLTDGPIDGPNSDYFLMSEYRDVLKPTVIRMVEITNRELQLNIARFPDRMDARYFRAKGLRLLGRTDEASRELEEALSRDSSFVPALALRGSIGGELDATLESIIAQGTADPSRPIGWGAIWARAVSAERHGDWEGAIAAYDDLVAMDAQREPYPGSAVEHLLRRGIARLLPGKYLAAALDFQAAQTRAKLDWGGFIEPTILLGRALYMIPSEELGDTVLSQALGGESTAAAEERSLWVAATYASIVNALSEKQEQQLIAARKLVEVRPQDAMSYLMLGWLLLVRVWLAEHGMEEQNPSTLVEMRDELSRLSGKALALSPQDPKVVAFSSKELEAEGRYAEALEQERRAFALERQKQHEEAIWRSPPPPAPGSQWNGAECEDGYFEVLGRIMDPGVNSPHSREWGLGISADGARLLFASNRPGGAGNYDIYISNQDPSGKFFSEARGLGEINTRYGERSPSLSGDGKSLYLQLVRPKGDAGGISQFGRAIWDPEKQDFTGLEIWSNFRVVPQSGYMGPLSISFDELELFFSAKERYGMVGDQNLYVAWRDSVKEEFSVQRSRRLREIDSEFDDVAPTVSRDGKTIFWTGFLSNSHAGWHGRDLVRASVWMAKRPRLRNPDHGEPEQFADIRWVRVEPEVPVCHFRVTGQWPEEGARAYFVSAMPGRRSGVQGGDYDIYVAVWHRRQH